MPIRVRLGLWYGAIFGVALLLFSVALYWFMARHLDRMIDETVASQAVHLLSAIAAANPSAAPGDDLKIPSLESFEASSVFVQVIASDGSVMVRSANLADQMLPARDGGTISLDGVKLKTSMAPLTIGGKAVAWVQVASSYRQRDMVLDRLKWLLIGGGLGSVVLAGLLGGALAGRALSPISEMAETARAIALSKGFSRRLSAGNPSDELGQLTQTFNEMLASLEEAYSAQQRFTADASHELRAPLTAIRGNLDLLDRVKDMPEEERLETLTQVRKEVERLSRLVNDLLTLARADAGQVMHVGPVELDALLVQVHRQAMAMANGVRVQLGHLEAATVQGDEDHLKQLLLILTDNALRYTPKAGTVTLSIKHQPPWVTVGVEDTGIGIEPEDMPHIFKRFWRADKARSRDSGGTGLGLSIAKWIVDQHGGEILVDSTPGKGSCFSARLPASS